MSNKIFRFPPCKICGGREMINKDLHIDIFGKMTGKWTCEYGHRNALE